MAKKITAVQALKGVAKLAKADPDIYRACRWVQDGQPYCIVANYLHDLGIPAAVLKQFGTMKFSTYGVEVALEDHGIVFETRAQRLLQSIQTYQDTGLNWGEALDNIIEDFSDVAAEANVKFITDLYKSR